MNAAELWGQIISGTVSGVVSGVLLAGTLFMLNWTRNRILESKLRRGFGRCGVGLHDGMFSLIVENRVPIEVRIRTIVLVGRQGHWQLHLKYWRAGAQAALLNALGHEKSPERIVAGAHFTTETHDDIAVSLAGFAGGLWGVSYEELLRYSWDVETGWMVIEYPTLFGGSAFLRVQLDPATVSCVQESVARVRAF